MQKVIIIIVITVLSISSVYFINKYINHNVPVIQNQSPISEDLDYIQKNKDLFANKEFSVKIDSSEPIKVEEHSFKNYKVVETYMYTTFATYYTKYYVKDNNIYYIESVINEWDLNKLYGENGDKNPSEGGEYVVATSTKEFFFIENNKLIKYVSDHPRVKSAAVTESNPDKDALGLISVYQEIYKNEK